MPQAAIFDIDGTLVDSVDLHALAWQEAFAQFGYDVSFEQARGQIGKGGDQLLPVFLNEAECAAQAYGLDKLRARILHDRYLDSIRPFPQVRALFERLRADGIRIVLASSAKSDELQHYQRLAEIGDLVDAETSSDDAAKSKPHPDIFDAALARLKDVAPDEALVIGDSPYDAEAAAKIGLRTIGLLCGGFPEVDLRGAGCIAIFDDPAGLLRNYDRSPLAGR